MSNEDRTDSGELTDQESHCPSQPEDACAVQPLPVGLWGTDPELFAAEYPSTALSWILSSAPTHNHLLYFALVSLLDAVPLCLGYIAPPDSSFGDIYSTDNVNLGCTCARGLMFCCCMVCLCCGLELPTQQKLLSRGLFAVGAYNLICGRLAYSPDHLQPFQHHFVFLHQGGCDQ